MSNQSVKIILIPPNADLDAISSCYGIWLLEKEANFYYTTLSKKAQKLFSIFKDKIDIIKKEDLDKPLIVYTADSSSIDSVLEAFKNIEKIILYDHHINHITSSKNIEIISDKLGANTSLITEHIINKNIHISKEDANILLCGIYDDTKYFSTLSTTSRDLKAASFLMDKGVDIEFVNNILKDYISLEDIIKIEHYIKNLEIVKIKDKKIGFINVENLKEDIMDSFSNIKELDELDAYFIIQESNTNTYLLARSKYMNVNSIISKLGGGGHELASGAKLSYISYQKLKNIILNIILQNKTHIKLKDIMTKNPLTLDSNTDIKDALHILSNYKLSKAPIVENNKIKGVITKKILTKAIHFIDKAPIKGFAIEGIVMKEEDFIWEAEEKLIKTPLSPMVIVVNDENTIKGVITKTDLIKYNLEEQKPIIKHAHIPDYILDIVKDIKSIIQKDQKIYLVGGVVRDILLRRSCYDVDFVIEGDINILEKSLQEHGIKTHRFKDFESLHFKYKDFKIEISTARREYYEFSGAYPIVSKASLREDLFRRDFTINTMLISLSDEDFGTLIDYFGAIEDLNNKIIRILHPLSFIEDPVRILRAIRFQAKLNFRLSKDTKRLLREALDKNLLKNAPKGRVFNEIKIVLQEKEYEKIFNLYKEYDIFEQIFENTIPYEQIEKYAKNLNMFSDWFLLEYKIALKSVPWIFFWLLIKEFDNKQEILKDISAPSFLYNFIGLQNNIKSLIGNLLKAKKPSEVYTILKPYNIEELGLIASQGNIDVLNRITKYLSHFKSLKPEIDISNIPPKDRSQVIENLKLIEMDKNYSL